MSARLRIIFGKSLNGYIKYTPQLTISNSSHLSSIFLTMDGNHHANRYFKNTDKHDVSLSSGLGYIPRKTDYKLYLGDDLVDQEV